MGYLLHCPILALLITHSTVAIIFPFDNVLKLAHFRRSIYEMIRNRRSVKLEPSGTQFSRHFPDIGYNKHCG
jgi:hypothetical protein